MAASKNVDVGMGKKIGIDEVNCLSLGQFTDRFGAVYEHSPWVAEQAWLAQPFADFNSLVSSMRGVVKASGGGVQRKLLCVHPQLAGDEAENGVLTQESREEQASVGLNRLTHEEKQWVEKFNQLYRDAFEFPFIIAVKNHTKQEVFNQMELRLRNCVEDEIKTALLQVDEIAEIRLRNLVSNQL